MADSPARAKLGPSKVVFACVANAGRSQIAEAFFNTLADRKRAYAVSAGTDPAAAVHPEVVGVMAEVGIDLSRARPQYLSTELCRNAHIVITMGCREACPLIPGLEHEDWPMEDPKGQSIERVRRIRDEIKKCVSALIEERKWG
jgi:arsenate reductase (thioredoxin)